MASATTRKVLIAVVIVGLIAAYFLLDLGQYFSLEYVKASRDRFQALYAEHAASTLAVYFFIYVTATALSLPAAAVLTLVGGALFGLVTGVIVASFASTIGAALAFLASRYLFRDYVQRKFGDKLSAVNRGVEKDGPFYLFTLRLVPVFPFFAINTLMALTPMRLFTYFWVSQIGMLPGTVVYVNAGRELGRIDSLSGLLSPGLILSFVIIGLFPLVARKGLDWLQARRNRG
ncbi:TVP38/TMEM64 family protein [Pseudodesulfovibrio portus]|uniref:TVP38/TMEM64 family membrane protein n=1 Tax=Pseudodesulfovibrio portus TaxID=231439 RepID=A0ABN6RSR3_9BACT|nr:TVP38/TMEM64 family protein [Pseudodesulfovibrio portus]BDQ32806.1 hypothetical protein JCM14722_03480 [Pseudodesulfovibrio portus]